MPYSVNVRTVAEFALERGDLAADFSALERMREGVEGHLRLQRQLGEGWRAEESVSLDVTVEEMEFRVQGRADAVFRRDGVLKVEEIKTTRRDPSLVSDSDHPEHWAQAEMYAAILCEKEERPFCEVALIYAHPDGGQARFSRQMSRENLRARFMGYLTPYARWMKALEVWRRDFMSSVGDLGFPFEHFRDGQRRMAANVYIAARDHKRVMIEAPTGIGKTAAALYGALKAMGEGRASSVFFLTARTTGRRSAENALEIMREKGLRVRSVTITAKEKCCVPGDVRCADCPFAQGYYDRRRAVLVSALRMEKLGEEEIYALAVQNSLCPFELSLDLAESADVIICDYNYVFDPRAKLIRFFSRKCECALLVDEAHNLPERAREMLSAELSGREIARLRRDLGKGDPLYPALTRALKAFRAGEDAEAEILTRPRDDIFDAAEKLAQDLTGALDGRHPLGRELVRLMLDAAWYAKRHGEFDEKTDRAIYSIQGKWRTVKLFRADPSVYIDQCLKKVAGTALFSATLTPADFYARELAVREEKGDAMLRLPSPFPPENQMTVLTRIPTRYAQRENTLSRVCQAIFSMTRGKPGHYIACFPSYAYLNAAFGRFSALFPEVRVLRQEAQMNQEQREAFLAEFEEEPERTMVAFAVLGGAFAEGVDLPGTRLIGAAIVSVGIPLICPEREVIREMNDTGEGEGYDFAYVYPGFRRVCQAAGRVIRTEEDRGVVLLIDDRFCQRKYARMMPPNWNVRVIDDPMSSERAFRRFWEKS